MEAYETDQDPSVFVDGQPSLVFFVSLFPPKKKINISQEYLFCVFFWEVHSRCQEYRISGDLLLPSSRWSRIPASRRYILKKRFDQKLSTNGQPVLQVTSPPFFYVHTAGIRWLGLGCLWPHEPLLHTIPEPIFRHILWDCAGTSTKELSSPFRVSPKPFPKGRPSKIHPSILLRIGETP